MPWPATIPLKPSLMTALASTMMIAVCAVVTTVLVAVALTRTQRTTIRQQPLKMDLAFTAKRPMTLDTTLDTKLVQHLSSALPVRILTVQGTSLLMGTSGLMTSFRCCRSTTRLVRNKPRGYSSNPSLAGVFDCVGVLDQTFESSSSLVSLICLFEIRR